MMKKKQFKRIVGGGDTKHVHVEFDFDGEDENSTYTSLIEHVRTALASHRNQESIDLLRESKWSDTHTLLPKQAPVGPARWIEIKLSADGHKTTLFVRDDNVYLVGFENQKGQKYQAGRGSGGNQILTGAISLGYDLSYGDLGDNRFKWNLQKDSASKAVIKLSTYGTEKKSNKKQDVKKYLARLIVMICEAARMCRIMTRVNESWGSADKKILTEIEWKTLKKWGSMSQVMMGCGTYTQGLKAIHVENDKQAGAVVRLIKYPLTRIKDNQSKGAGGDDPSDASRGGGNGHGTQPGDGNNGHWMQPGDGNNGHGTQPGDGNNGHGRHPGDGNNGHGTQPGDGNRQKRQKTSHQQRQRQGRSLVEMCSIEVTEECTLPGVGVCSITVFDGKRGQVIYWGVKDGDAPRVDSKGNFLLTGPYRAIAADGTVAVRIITTVSDSNEEKDNPRLPSQKDKQEDDLLIWDPYTEDHYDELVSGDIAKGLMLTYAVLRSAVEATVQVDVFLARGIDFFGEISAHSKLENGEVVSVVLFSREIKDRVVFKPSSAGSTVPLTRAVLAWAVGSPLLIKVKRCRSVNLTHNGLHLRTNVEHSFRSLEFSFDDQKDKICFYPLHGFGNIRVSVDDTREHRKKSDSNSLPRSLDQLSRDQTLAAKQNTIGFREESSPLENQDDPTRMDILHSESGVQYSMGLRDEQSPFENWDQDDPTRKDILEPEPGSQDSMGPEDIETPTKLLVVRSSQLRFITIEEEKFITCLLHLTNNSNDQHAAFRCGSILVEDRLFRQYQIGHSSARTWQFSGILPPNSTSAYLVRRQVVWRQLAEMGTLSMTLESCVARQDEKQQAEGDVGLDTIFEAAQERTQKVILKATTGDLAMRTSTSEQAEGDEVDLDTLFRRTSKGIKEVTIKATVSHPADVPMTSETEMKVPVTESSINQSDLDVYPLQLRFPFKQDKMICCPLRLTNRTDHYVIFKCLPYTTYSYLYTLDHLNGILPPRSACTYVVAMEKQKNLPDNMDALSVILKSCKVEKITGPGEYISSQDPMDGPIPPRIEIITVTGKDYEILSMDVHPTEPWILASHFNGNVSIWNYQTEARVMELTVPDSRVRSFSRCIYSAKFIAAEKWIVAGGGNGVIYMVEYMTKEVKKFQAHRNSVESLAVHPNKPFVLSACYDGTIKLWNWDVNRDPIWQNTRTFCRHGQVVNYVMFNPYDNGNTFASASDDLTVKIWSTNDPNDQPKPIATLDCGEVRPQHVAYYSMGGRQYMITGSLKGAARVWDLEKPNEPIKELDGLAKEKKSTPAKDYGINVGVLNCVPDDINPVLITVSGDMGISFLDATTYKPRYYKVNFGLGVAMGFAVIDVKGKRSLAIALREGIAIMEMNEDQVNSPATVEQAQEGIYSAESSNDQ